MLIQSFQLLCPLIPIILYLLFLLHLILLLVLSCNYVAALRRLVILLSMIFYTPFLVNKVLENPISDLLLAFDTFFQIISGWLLIWLGIFF